MSNAKNKLRRVQPLEQIKQTFVPNFPTASVREHLQPTVFLNSLEIKLCNIVFPLDLNTSRYGMYEYCCCFQYEL